MVESGLLAPDIYHSALPLSASKRFAETVEVAGRPDVDVLVGHGDGGAARPFIQRDLGEDLELVSGGQLPACAAAARRPKPSATPTRGVSLISHSPSLKDVEDAVL
jgi:hypothetical protein